MIELYKVNDEGGQDLVGKFLNYDEIGEYMSRNKGTYVLNDCVDEIMEGIRKEQKKSRVREKRP